MTTIKLRSDAWTTDDDRILIDIVVQNMRKGITQKESFKMAGLKLGRTDRACGFRWNSKLRHNHKKHIQEARKECNSKYNVKWSTKGVEQGTLVSAKSLMVMSKEPIWAKYVTQGSTTYVEILNQSPTPEEVLAGGYIILSPDTPLKLSL